MTGDEVTLGVLAQQPTQMGEQFGRDLAARRDADTGASEGRANTAPAMRRVGEADFPARVVHVAMDQWHEAYIVATRHVVENANGVEGQRGLFG
jgi:hypothetical protein